MMRDIIFMLNIGNIYWNKSWGKIFGEESRHVWGEG